MVAAARLSLLASGMTTALSLSALTPLAAADLTPQQPVQYAAARSFCGRCGCLDVTYIRHRELESTYGLAFDPRNDDQTEPYFYLGRMRAYPRYAVDGVAAAGPLPHCY
jgi:hypothetical protein